MTGRTLKIPSSPKRIVSLVPSQTELLYDLGLDEEVIAITKFCVHPEEWFRNKIRIGGTKNLNIEKIKALHPDLIIANKEENTKEQIEELTRFFPVWISDIKNVADACRMICEVGELVGKSHKANAFAAIINQQFAALHFSQKSVAYFIWYQPWMSVGHDTFIHDILQRSGFKNVFDHHKRYPEITETQLKQAQPEIVLLSSEPFPFKEKHAQEIKKILPDAAVYLVDGEMFSWYGSRMLKAISYIKEFVQHCS